MGSSRIAPSSSAAFYLPAGHIPVANEPGSEMVQFSPAEALRDTAAVMEKNMQAIMAS